MSIYSPPVQDMQFLLCDVLGFNHDEIDDETLGAILEEASKLASDVLAPINWDGDQHGATLKNGEVTTAPGFKDAYAQYRDGGWNAVPFTPDFGGQGLPYGVAFPVQEMWQGANMSFGLCPLLNQGAVEAILIHGSQEQKDTYLEKLISGEWTGTMNLTEPQAGSDLGLLRESRKTGGWQLQNIRTKNLHHLW
jgi:alkylation response protein AidB-like acyl-CoA dehydrogenase